MQQLPEFASLSGKWWNHLDLMKDQLTLLKKSGVTGLRLNIFSSELTTNARTIRWQPLESFLDLAEKLNLEIHLCLGPYQYPLWPGIRLPEVLLDEKTSLKVIDGNKKWKEFGCGFLEEELKQYGKHKNITGFYLGNEWHTTQRIEDYSKKNMTFTISQKHMESLARLCKKFTRKPILFNTNLQPHQLKQLEHTFLSILKVLKNQAWVGFDLYPTQENFTKAPQLFIHRKLHSFSHDVESIKKEFIPRVLISEFEAQPWGDGESWHAQITKNPVVVQSTAEQLEKTFRLFTSPKLFDQVTLWGAEFWLIAYQMGHPEMLDAVSQLG